MPSLELPSAPRYVPAKPTQQELEYADLVMIDLSKADTLEGRKELASQLLMAMQTQGFFYVINHGYTQAQTDRVFDIANIPFDNVFPEEKIIYTETAGSSTYQGYKPSQTWHIKSGVRDRIEQYAINHNVNKVEHPEPFRPFLPELEAFARHNHFNILHPLLRIFALALELPEETFVDVHRFDAISGTAVRFVKYYPRSDEEEEKTNNVWLKGHADIGTVTILWSQPVAALQILSPDGKWRWIRHIDNALTINTGDSMEFLSGGFYKPTVHRVVQPPIDQRNRTRLGVFYFGMTDDELKLLPRAESPVLQRVGIQKRFEDKDAPVMEEWRKSRTTSYGVAELKMTESGTKKKSSMGLSSNTITKVSNVNMSNNQQCISSSQTQWVSSQLIQKERPTSLSKLSSVYRSAYGRLSQR